MAPPDLISLIQRDQALILSYTFLMRPLVATLITLMLFAATPVVAGDYWDGVAERDMRLRITTLV